MKTEKQKLLDWLVDTIRRDYPEDICLVVTHNHLVLPEDGLKQTFDYYVPATPRGLELARTFMIHGIGLDLYPRSWERLEGMARLEDFNTSILADAQILYSRSPEDEARFRQIQQQLLQNLQDSSFVYQKALENLRTAMDLFQTMLFKDDIGSLRLAAGYIQNYLAIALAFLNHQCLKNSQENQLEELADMPLLPAGILPLFREIIHLPSGPRLKEHCYQIITVVRKFLEAQALPAAAEKQPELAGLAEWYQELSYTWRRIRWFCQNGDAQKAFQWGCYLQSELDVVSEEFSIPPMDLMGFFDPEDLSVYQKQAEALENQILALLSQNEIPLASYDSVDAFIAAQS